MLAIAQSAALLLIPWLGGRLLGGVVAGEGVSQGLVVPFLVLALAAMALSSTFAAMQSRITGARILADLRQDAYDHVMTLPVSFHDRQRQGELLSLIAFEVSSLSAFLSGTLATAPAMTITAIGALVVLFVLDPALAIAIPVVVPAFVIGVRLAGRRLRHLAHEVRLAEAGVISEAEAHLGIVPAIKAFAVEDLQATRYRERIAAVFRRTRAQALAASAIGPALGFAAGCVAIVVLGFAGDRMSAGAMSTEDLFKFLLYAALLTRPVAALGDAYGSLQTARGALHDLERLMRQPPETGLGHGIPLPRIEGRIAFENVAFAYPDRGPVLCGASFAVAPGETVALTGANGAGKSTLIALLLRFYEPSSGRITVDGHSIGDVDVQSLRRQIGYVPQRPLMFNGTVRENIAFGHPDASEAQLTGAIAVAQAGDFIDALPQKLDTPIGDHGVLLSGGQRQRLALARALLADPPILIFDEATSMVDLEGEAAFVEACASALEGRTVLLVTHRPASLSLADRILVVSEGQVREVPHPAPPRP